MAMHERTQHPERCGIREGNVVHFAYATRISKLLSIDVELSTAKNCWIRITCVTRNAINDMLLSSELISTVKFFIEE